MVESTQWTPVQDLFDAAGAAVLTAIHACTTGLQANPFSPGSTLVITVKDIHIHMFDSEYIFVLICTS